MNAIMAFVSYFPVKNTTSDTTLTYELYKEGELHADATYTLVHSLSKVIDKYIWIRPDLDGSQFIDYVDSYQPDKEEVMYCNLDYTLVGGGGGGTSELQPYYPPEFPGTFGRKTLLGGGGGGGQVITGSLSTIPNSLISVTCGRGGLHGAVAELFNEANTFTGYSVLNDALSGQPTTITNFVNLNVSAPGGTPAIRGNGSVPGDGGDSGSNQGSPGFASGVNYAGGLGAGAGGAPTTPTSFSNGVVGTGVFVTISDSGQIRVSAGGGRGAGSGTQGLYIGSGSYSDPANYVSVSSSSPDFAISALGYGWGGRGATAGLQSGLRPWRGGHGTAVLRIKNF
jgi:hypothetical protein